MKHCFSTIGCPNFSLIQVLELSQFVGFPGVELRTLEGSTNLPQYISEKFSDVSAVRQLIEMYNIQLPVIGTSFRLTQPSNESWEELIEFVCLAESLQVPWLRVFDGPMSPLGARSSIEAMQAVLKEWEMRRNQSHWKVCLAIETHSTLLTADLICNLFANLGNTSSRVLWDVHHTWRAGNEDPLVTWNSIAENVVHIHVKDSLQDPSVEEGFRYVLPGKGQFPAPSLYKKLQENDFDGFVSLEWERQWHPELPTLEMALDSAKQYYWI